MKESTSLMSRWLSTQIKQRYLVRKSKVELCLILTICKLVDSNICKIKKKLIMMCWRPTWRPKIWRYQEDDQCKDKIIKVEDNSSFEPAWFKYAKNARLANYVMKKRTYGQANVQPLLRKLSNRMTQTKERNVAHKTVK